MLNRKALATIIRAYTIQLDHIADIINRIDSLPDDSIMLNIKGTMENFNRDMIDIAAEADE
ncbi:MAG: hypothetical protein ACYTE8_00995 [Planctomycetota bacterium]|jgi:hypothetical protein